MANSRRWFPFLSPPFSYLIVHLAQDGEFLSDAKAILALDEDSFRRLATQLANSDTFLSGADVKRIVAESLDCESDHIAKIINSIASVVHEAEMTAADAMSEFDEAIQEKCVGLEPEQRRSLCERLRKLVVDPIGIAKQYKARRLADAIGAELDDFQIVCDIRPIFDRERERIDGAMPIALLRLDYENPDGEQSVVELRVTEKQVSQLADKLKDAQRKLTMIKEFLASSGVAIPRIKTTLNEENT